jgi:predicted AAA+ superfamily ATPase
MTNREVLIEINHWWTINAIRPELLEKVERRIFPQVLSAMQERQALLFQGPRRVGKSTLMFHLIHHLLQNGYDPKLIIYASMDDPLLKKETFFEDIIGLLENLILGKPILECSKNIYLFLDEITRLENWELFVKRFIDQKYPFKFILSSSSASLLQKRSQESLVGRVIEFNVPPFSFSEYAELMNIDVICQQREILEPFWQEFFQTMNAEQLTSGLANIDKQQRFHQKEFDLTLRAYLRDGGFPEFLQLQDSFFKTRYFWDNVAERTLYYDIPEIFRINDRELLQKLFVYCISHSGSMMNMAELATSFAVPRQTISNYLSYLNAGLLVHSLEKYAKTAASRLRAFKKVYACDQGLVVHLQRFNTQQIDEKGLWGQLCEIAVFSQLRHYHPARIYYYRDREREVDFVIDIHGQLIPIEAKYRESISIPTGLTHFKNHFHTDFEIVITKNHFEQRESVLFVPLRLFLS